MNENGLNALQSTVIAIRHFSHGPGTDDQGRHNIFWFLLRSAGATDAQIDSWTNGRLVPDDAAAEYLAKHYDMTEADVMFLAAANEEGRRGLLLALERLGQQFISPTKRRPPKSISF